MTTAHTLTREAAALRRRAERASGAEEVAELRQAATRARKAAAAACLAAEDRLRLRLEGVGIDHERVAGLVAGINARASRTTPGPAGPDPRLAAVAEALDTARRTGDEHLLRAAVVVGTDLTTGANALPAVDDDFLRALREAHLAVMAPARQAAAELDVEVPSASRTTDTTHTWMAALWVGKAS